MARKKSNLAERVILESCSLETSSDFIGWNENNPAWGHSDVIALLIQEILGGEIIRVSLSRLTGYSSLKNHYRNRFWPGLEVDFAFSQFSEDAGDRDSLPKDRAANRETLLKNPDVKKRYELFKKRIQERLKR